MKFLYGFGFSSFSSLTRQHNLTVKHSDYSVLWVYEECTATNRVRSLSYKSGYSWEWLPILLAILPSLSAYCYSKGPDVTGFQGKRPHWHLQEACKESHPFNCGTHSLTHSPSLLLVRHKPSPCVILWYSITNYLFLQYELRLWHQSICHPFNCGNHSLTHSSSSSLLKHKASPHVILWYSSTNLFLWPQTITSIISYIVIHPGFVTMTLFLLNLVNWTSQFPNSSTPLTPDKDNRDNRRRGHCLTREGAIEFSNLPT